MQFRPQLTHRHIPSGAIEPRIIIQPHGNLQHQFVHQPWRLTQLFRPFRVHEHEIRRPRHDVRCHVLFQQGAVPRIGKHEPICNRRTCQSQRFDERHLHRQFESWYIKAIGRHDQIRPGIIVYGVWWDISPVDVAEDDAKYAEFYIVDRNGFCVAVFVAILLLVVSLAKIEEEGSVQIQNKLMSVYDSILHIKPYVCFFIIFKKFQYISSQRIRWNV
mmetsp:Transcript_8481/g.12758  ORF Transcript_8481/g.12758 Transcript_8481/m.12758 type:complete len:217 (-) Transcript_8481:50-700(-)